MTTSPSDALLTQFRQSLEECRQLYISSAQLCIEQYPNMIPGSPLEFTQLMDDLHKGLVIKVYVSVVEADARWTREEKQLGRVLFDHIWPGAVSAARLREAAGHVFREARSLKWYSLVRPFLQIAPLRDKVSQLQTLIVRLSHLVAKADGHSSPAEQERLREIQQEIELHLKGLPLDERGRHEEAQDLRVQAVQQMQEDSRTIRQQCDVQSDVEIEVQQKTREEQLQESLEQLDLLIGLQQVKHEIRSLTNFLKLQQQREAAGLPTTELSLHLVFGGNPGTATP